MELAHEAARDRVRDGHGRWRGVAVGARRPPCAAYRACAGGPSDHPRVPRCRGMGGISGACLAVSDQPISRHDRLAAGRAGVTEARRVRLAGWAERTRRRPWHPCMFDYHNIDLEGKDVVIINRRNLIGKPLYHLLLEKNATVITCHSKTKNLKEHCQNADIVITAVGDRTKFTLTPDMIKEGAVVIDVAITRHEEKLVGDADYDKIIEKASFATPVPGGVGPMTVAMLLKNTVTAASLSKGLGI